MKMTRSIAVKAELGTALSALILSALRADQLPHAGKEGNRAMSHHLDTPLAAQNGQLYIDDFYVFGGKDGTVFVMDVNSTVTGADVQPGFHQEARYEFKVHFDGASTRLTYRVSFGEPDSDGRQSLQVHALTGPEARDDSVRASSYSRAARANRRGGDARIWAGRIGDPFYADLAASLRSAPR